MSKRTLETETRYVWAILGRQNAPLTEDFNVYYERLKGWLDFDAEIYAFIGHDKDVDDDGKPKFRHIHLLIVFPKNKKPRLSVTLNKISRICNIPTIDIDVELADDVGKCIRYCIHKGYPTKYPYDIKELQTNLNDVDLKQYFEVDLSNISVGYLLTCIEICGYSNIAVMRSLGLKTYMKYRNVINDVIKEIKETQQLI